MAASPATADFLEKVLAVERAWLMLDAAGRDEDVIARIEEAIAEGGHATQVLIRAGEMLAAHGHADAARRTLEKGLALDGPTAPLQAALARQLRALGDLDGAARWLRGAALRARPDARLMTTLAAVELEAGRTACAEAILHAAFDFATNEGAGLVEDGRRLRDLGRADLALIPFILAHRRGYREDGFLSDFGTIVGDETLPVIDPAVQLAVGVRAAHLKLVDSFRDDPVVGAARDREMSAGWVATDDMVAALGTAIARRRPYSWIRLGEGEARFLLLDHPELRGSLTGAETALIGRVIWQNWFGEDVREVDPARITDLSAQLDAAIGNADLLGLTTSARFAVEPEHFGSLVALERHVARLAPAAHSCDALASLTLNERDPFYASLLRDLDFLGVIGPHAGLAGLLAERLGIARTASYLIPGEGRLGRPQDATDRGRHFPQMFDRLMAEISVPYEGAVFLVAGGLLGKLYCDRVKRLGGIALDIGAVADAWMGYNTRGIILDLSMRHRLVS